MLLLLIKRNAWHRILISNNKQEISSHRFKPWDHNTQTGRFCWNLHQCWWSNHMESAVRASIFKSIGRTIQSLKQAWSKPAESLCNASIAGLCGIQQHQPSWSKQLEHKSMLGHIMYHVLQDMDRATVQDWFRCKAWCLLCILMLCNSLSCGASSACLKHVIYMSRIEFE